MKTTRFSGPTERTATAIAMKAIELTAVGGSSPSPREERTGRGQGRGASHGFFSNGASRNERALTLVDVLVMVLVVALLAVTALPALSRTAVRSTRMQCMSNLSRFSMAVMIYTTSKDNFRLPSGIAGGWAWDIQSGLVNEFLNVAPGGYGLGSSGVGVTRDIMYDPAFPQQNNNGLWNFSVNNYRIIGYAMTLPGTASVISTNQNPTILSQPILIAGNYVSGPPISQRVLIADATISLPGQNQTNAASRASYTYKGIQGGYNAPGWTGHQTSHLKGTMPDGGNLAMLDGHVEWHRFQDMIPRTTGGSPVFWW